MVIWSQVCEFVNGLKPVILMVIAQVALAGVNVLYKLAVYDGMSLKIMIAYRLVFATVFMAPVAFIVERKTRPKLTWVVLLQSFACGLLGGSLAQNLYVGSLALTSATYASAMTNLIPAITFILAVSFGLEKLGLKTVAGNAKVLGTLMGVSGAMLLTFYRGPPIDFWSTHIDLVKANQPHGGHVASSYKQHNKVLGSLLAVGSCLCFALWLILQAKMSEKYPCPYSSTALLCIMGSVQSIAFALCTERDWSQWKLGWNIRLLTVAYSGIVGSGLMITITLWGVRMRGPLYVSVFNPVMLVLVAFAGSLVLDEKLYLGSIIGAIFIICGLYLVLWGKGKEKKKKSAPLVSSISSPRSDTNENIASSLTNNNTSTDKINTDLSENVKREDATVQG